MSFFDALKSMGLSQGGQPNPMVEAYGLDPAAAKQAAWQAIGNISGNLMALGQQMTPDQRARMLGQMDWSGGLQSSLYNQAQMKLMSDARKRKSAETERAEQARTALAEMIQKTPAGRKRDAAMFFLQADDLEAAGKVLFAEPEAPKPTEMKTVRVGNRDVTYQWNPSQNQWVKFGEGDAFAPKEPPVSPSSVREFEYAKQQGYEGGYEDFLKMATAAKSGVQLPAEMGSRIGLGDEFLQNDLPEIKKDVASGVATGPIDYLTGWAGRGRSGEIQRRLLTGVDALRRNLTGAGMGMQETEEYVKRYQPSMTDDAETLMSKINGLERDLKAVKEGAIAGKSGTMSEGGAPSPNQPKRLKFNPVTGELE